MQIKQIYLYYIKNGEIWSDDDAFFVLDKHAALDFSVLSLKNSPQVEMSLHSVLPG